MMKEAVPKLDEKEKAEASERNSGEEGQCHISNLANGHVSV